MLTKGILLLLHFYCEMLSHGMLLLLFILITFFMEEVLSSIQIKQFIEEGFDFRSKICPLGNSNCGLVSGKF